MIGRYALTALAAALAVSSDAAAQQARADTVSAAHLVVRETCIVAPPTATTDERAGDTRESLTAALLTVGAKLLGDVVGAGLNALGDALLAASQEHGYVAQGESHFLAYDIRLPEDGRKLADLQARSACLILYTPGATGTFRDLKERLTTANARQPAGSGFTPFADEKTATAAQTSLAALGVTGPPALYIEVEIWPSTDGLVVRPVMLWYETALAGAPKGALKSELHITLATPAAGANATSLGAAFAMNQIKLDKMAPGTVLGPLDLKGIGFIAVPPRATTGSADTFVAAINATYTAAATAATELRSAETARLAADRKAARDKTAENVDLAKAAAELVAFRKDALKNAQDTADAQTDGKAGTTNAQVRFVVLKDANKFGIAVANALKTRGTEAGTAVGVALTPKEAGAEWAPADTAYITAENAVTAKQRLLDGLPATDAAGRAVAAEDLRVLQSKLNEAAITAKRPIPYPGLLPPR